MNVAVLTAGGIGSRAHQDLPKQFLTVENKPILIYTLARSGYNEAKRTCEALTQSYRSVFGVNAVIARFARVFGADKKHDTRKSNLWRSTWRI